MKTIQPRRARATVLAWTVILPFQALSAAPPIDDAADAAQSRVSKAKETKVLEVDLSLIRRAVIAGLVNAREGKRALKFDRLRRDKEAGTLSEQEVDARLEELGISWEEGAALLKRLAPAASVLANGDFESGKAVSADGWSAASSHPPKRSKKEAHVGFFSMHSKLTNKGATPCEGLLRSKARVDGGETYSLQFWIKPVAVGPSYVTQYRLQWLDRRGRVIRGTGFVAFKGRPGRWTKIDVPKLAAPKNAEKASLTFRFVTGAVNGGHGEIYIDDVVLR